jgi:uncharacterized protein (DUF1501 family)
MTETCSCPEYRSAGLSRRRLLGGAALVGLGATTALFGEASMTTAWAATPTAARTLVVLSMRGAVDGMSLVVPHGDPVYYQARPRIGIPVDALLERDHFFGLHPNLAPLLPMWTAGKVAAIHATGLPAPNRSHFSAMEAVEDADPGSSARIGWLNRLVGRHSSDHPLQGMGFGSTAPPTSLVGPAPVVVAKDVDSLALAGEGDTAATRRARRDSVETLWGGDTTLLGDAVRTALRAVDAAGPIRASGDRPLHGAAYPRGDLGEALAAAARTIRADVGAEVITVDHGDWDHHTGLGTLQWGEMQRMTTELGQALAAFFTDLGDLGDKVTLVTISEFGRRTKENANHGLDHGHGNVMFVLGAGVNGGYHGTFPALANTLNGDLLVTTDYRSVLAEVVSRRLGASPAAVFPGFTPESVGAVL